MLAIGLVPIGFLAVNLARYGFPRFVLSALSVLPLAFALILALALFDPAWSHERWQRKRLWPHGLGRFLRAHALLVLAGAVIGLLSGIIIPHPLGTRGAILGAAMAGAVAVMNGLNQARLGAGQRPSSWPAFPVAVLGSLMCLLFFELPGLKSLDLGEFGKTEMFLPRELTFLLLLFYFLTKTLVYPLRFRPETWSKVLPVLILPIFYAINVLRFGFMPEYDLREVLFYAAVNAIPFGVLCLASLALFDPAWSLGRWARRGMATSAPPREPADDR